MDELLGRGGICAHGVGTGLVEEDGKTGWPEYFPDRPVMFMAHNWGNDRMLCNAQRNGGEGDGEYWNRLQDWVRRSHLNFTRLIFATNIFPGIKKGLARGRVTRDNFFITGSLRYAHEQVRIVQPRLVVTLGGASRNQCRRAKRNHGLTCKLAHLMHPNAPEHCWGFPSYKEWSAHQIEKLNAAFECL